MALSTDTIWSAKGDLIAGTGNDAAAVVNVTTTAGNVLTKDSAASTGLAWTTPWHLALAPAGAVAETTPRQLVDGDTLNTLTSGTLRLIGIYLPKDVTITSITFVAGSTGMSSGNNQWFALYDSARALLRQTTDDTSTAWSANTAKTLNLTSTYTTTSAGLYYIGIMVNAATTPRPQGNALAGGTLFLDLTNKLCGNTSDTGLTSTAPANAGAITSSANIPYAYCS